VYKAKLPNCLLKWKAQAQEAAARSFEDVRKTKKDLNAAHAQQVEERYAQIKMVKVF
jgi:hypothetical protein